MNNSQLNVLMVTPRYFPDMGGIETHVYEVARRLVTCGAQVTVLTTDRSGELPPDESIDNVKILRVPAYPAKRDYYFAPRISDVIRRNAWDIVHCQGYHTFVPPLAMLAARRARIPYVVTFHSGGHSSKLRNMIRDGQVFVQRSLLRGSAQLIGVSHFEADLFSKRIGISPNRFVVIPNGSHLPRLTSPVTTDNTKTLILSIGRLEKYKGHHRIITAFPKILEQRSDAVLRIVGAGPYENVLRQLVARLGLSERVTIGAIASTDREGMASMLAQASLVTLLSDYEAHPISVMEALSMQRPVLVTATSGLQELADQGLVRSISLNSTPAEVANAVIDQLAHPLIPRQIELPTWDNCAVQLLEVYIKIVHSHPVGMRLL